MKVYKISIITPNYNYANFIGQTIQSVIDQNYPNFEYIIVDDGSSDNSAEVIEEFVKSYPDKIKLIRQENQGQTNAVNNALKNVTGDIIGWINSDDMFCDNAFHEIVKAFLKHPEADAIFGNIYLIDDKDKILSYRKYLNFDYASGVFNDFGKIVPSNAIFWKSQLTNEIGFLNESYIYSMDGEYWSRLLLNRKVIHINIPIAMWRQHPQAKTNFRQNKQDAAYIKATLENDNTSRQAYKNLWMYRFLPYKYRRLLKIYYKIKRLASKFALGHYFQRVKPIIRSK